MDGTGEMLNKPEAQTKESLIEVYASFIRHIDELRIDLTAELDAVRKEREQLHEERKQLQSILQQFLDHMRPVEYKINEPDHLKAAESNKENKPKN